MNTGHERPVEAYRYSLYLQGPDLQALFTSFSQPTLIGEHHISSKPTGGAGGLKATLFTFGASIYSA
jgi:hypothetical protein